MKLLFEFTWETSPRAITSSVGDSSLFISSSYLYVNNMEARIVRICSFVCLSRFNGNVP